MKEGFSNIEITLHSFMCAAMYLYLWIHSLLYQSKEDEINQLKQDTLRLTKMRETIQRKLRTVEDQKGDTEQQKETLKSQIIALERGKHNHSLLGDFKHPLIHIIQYPVISLSSGVLLLST